MKILRRLELRDVPGMLEWMHDPETSENFRVDFASFTREDAERFIAGSFTARDQHFAFVDEHDEYMGTVSLKHIGTPENEAEYAVVTRQCARGSGLPYAATEELLSYAFRDLKLVRIYLNVLEENERANRFYQKCGFVYCGKVDEPVLIKGQPHTQNRYAIENKGE